MLQLAGEQQPAGDMSMGGMPGADMGTNDLGTPPPEGGADLGAEAPVADAGAETDGFDAVDAAAGGSQALGRARR